MIFDTEKDIIFAWCFGMATIENFMVSKDSKMFKHPQILEKMLILLRKCPVEINQDATDTFNRYNSCRFGISNIYQNSQIIEREDLTFKKLEDIEIHGIKGKYFGQAYYKQGFLYGGTFIPHGIGRFYSDDEELLFDGQFEDGSPHGHGQLIFWD